MIYSSLSTICQNYERQWQYCLLFPETPLSVTVLTQVS